MGCDAGRASEGVQTNAIPLTMFFLFTLRYYPPKYAYFHDYYTIKGGGRRDVGYVEIFFWDAFFIHFSFAVAFVVFVVLVCCLY